jgi:uncharacterized membrane protein
MSRARLAPLALLLIGLVGVGISIYLTTVHYARVPLACTSSGVVNCERVLSSSYSSVAGVPLAVGGIAWFGTLALLALPALLWEREPAWLQPAQVLWSLAGLATVLYLVGVEVLGLGVLCLWCTVLHVLIVASLLLSVLRTPPAVERCAPAPAARIA